MSKIPPRIIKELDKLNKEPPPDIQVTAMPDNIRYLNIVLIGPKDTPYEGGIFKLEMFLPNDYPLVPPIVRFLTKIYHPNVDRIGRICLDILKDKWSPALQIRTLLLSIQALMAAPNPDDPLVPDIANEWKTNIEKALSTAREWTAQYAVL